MYKTSTLAIVFLIYVLLVGIILYLVFKKLNKREYLWVAIPVTAILFCVLFFAMGTKTRVKDVVLNQVTFLTKEKDGTNNNTVYVGITSKYNKDLLVKNPEEGNLELINDEGHYYSSNDEESKNSKIRTKIIYNGSNTSYEYKDLPALNMKTFKINNVDKTFPDIQANLSYNGGELKGTIKNTLGYDIKSLIILSQNEIWNYGEVKEGEEINTENNKASKIKNIYGGMYSFMEGENRLSGRIRTILYSLTDTMYSGNGIKIVAITEIPMDYKFDFGNRKVSKFDTTVIVQDGNLNIADENGNCSLPFEYFTPEVSSSQGDVYCEENMINGTGDLYLEYTIDSNIDVNKLTIGYIKEDEDYYYQEELKGKLYIVNRTKNDFEEIEYLESGVVLSNPKDYLTEDNKLYMRLECNDEMNVSCPKIAVEGVVNNVEN